MSNPWSHHPPSPSPVHSIDARRGSAVACSSASTQAAAHLPHHLQLHICTGSVRVWSFHGWHEILPPLLARRAPLRRLSSSAPGEEGDAQAENHSSTTSGFSIQKVLSFLMPDGNLVWVVVVVAIIVKMSGKKHMSSFRRNLRAAPTYRDEEVLEEEEEQDARSYAGDDMADMHLHDDDDFLSRRVVLRGEQHNEWIPSIVAFISVAVSFFIKESMSYLPIILFGIYMSWIYLRYFQRRLEVGLKGDPSDEFSFSSFFPRFLRPILDPIASIFHKLFCGRSARPEGTGQTLDGSQFPGSGSIEANRRRERGQRALEQRLAEKLAAVRNAEGTPPPKQQQKQREDAEDDASDKV